MSGETQTAKPLDFPVGDPTVGALTEVAPGVRILPLPVDFQPFHVNAVVLDDGPRWTILDTGYWNEKTQALWREMLEGPLAAKPLGRVIASHHHPDHIGLAGWFQADFGAELWTTRTAWLFARMLQLDAWSAPPAEAARHYLACGYDAPMMERWRARAARNFSVTVAPLPLGFRAVPEGAGVEIGGAAWRVLFGHGHAPDHLMLLREADGVLLAGDQILPRITPNIGVYPTEPDADPLGDWIAACQTLRDRVDDRMLTIPGHGSPFRGAQRRLDDVIAKHGRALARLEEHLATPRRVVDCFAALFRRTITASLEGLATNETVAHLNRLTVAGRAVRTTDDDGVHYWRRADV